jgi:hypothetical protein
LLPPYQASILANGSDADLPAASRPCRFDGVAIGPVGAILECLLRGGPYPFRAKRFATAYRHGSGSCTTRRSRPSFMRHWPTPRSRPSIRSRRQRRRGAVAHRPDADPTGGASRSPALPERLLRSDPPGVLRAGDRQGGVGGAAAPPTPAARRPERRSRGR